MVNRIAVEFSASGDFTRLLGEIKAINAELNKINTAYATAGSAGKKALTELDSAIVSQVSNLKGWQSSQLTVKSSVNQLTDDIIRQKYHLQGFPNVINSMKTAWSDAGKVAEQQLRTMNSQFVALSRDQYQNVSGRLIRPTGDINQLVGAEEKLHMQMSVFNGMLNSSATRMINWGKNVQWAGRQLTYGLSLPIAGVIAGMGMLSYKLTEQQSRLKAVYGDASTSSKELDQAVRETTVTAKEMASQFGVTGSETTSLAADFAAAGYQGQALQKIVTDTTRIQVLGETDRQSALQASISLMNAFHLSADQLTNTFNHMNAVENQTVLTTNDMIEAIPRAAAPIAQLGGSVSDLIVLLTAMKAGGINAEQGSVAINRAITSLIRPTDKAAKELDTMGVHIDNLFEKHQNDAMPVLATFQDLGRQLDKLTSTERQQAIVALFGKFQNPRITAMLDNIISKTGKVGDQVQQALQAVGMTSDQAAAVTQREINQRMNSTAGRLKRYWAEITTSLSIGGQQMLKIITPVVGLVAKIVDALSNLPGPVKTFAAFAATLIAMVGPFTMLVGLSFNFFGNVTKGVLALWKYSKGLMDVETREQIVKKITDSLKLSFAEEQDSVETLVTSLQGLIEKYDILARKQGFKASGVNYIPPEGMAIPGALPDQAQRTAEEELVMGMPTGSLGQTQKQIMAQEEVSNAAKVTNDELQKTVGTITKTTEGTRVWGSALGRSIPTVANLALGIALLKGNSDGVGKSIGGWLIALTPILFVLPNIVSGIGKIISKIQAAAVASEAFSAAEGGTGLIGTLTAGIGTAGLVGLGVGALATAAIGAYVIWHRHQEDVAKMNKQLIQENVDLANSSHEMSAIIGQNWKQDTVAVGLYSKGVREATNVDQLKVWGDQWRKSSEGAYEALYKLKDSTKGITQFMQSQIAEMQIHGLGTLAIQDQVDAMLTAIGRSDLVPTINVTDLKFKTNQEAFQRRIDDFMNGPNGIAQMFANTDIKRLTIFKSGSSFGESLMKDLVGQPEAVIQRTINDLINEFDAKKQGILTGIAAKLKDDQSRGTFAGPDIAGWLSQRLGIDTSKSIDDITSQLSGVSLRKLNEALTWKGLNPDLEGAIQQLRSLKQASVATGEGILGAVGASNALGGSEADLNTVGGFLKDTLIGSGEAAEGTANGLKDVGNAAKVAIPSLAGMTKYLSNLQSNISSGLGDITNFVMQQYDTQTQAQDDALTQQQQQQDKSYSRRITASNTFWNILASSATKGYIIPKKAAEEYYNTYVKGEDSTVKARNAANKLIAKYNGDSWKQEKTRIQVLKERMNAEKAAEAQRQRIFAAEQTRLQQMASLEQININYQAALAGGNLDQAAQFMAQGMSQTMQNALQAAQNASSNQATTNQQRLQGRINAIQEEQKHRNAWLQNERDANKRALENDKATNDRRIADYKKTMDEMRAARRDELNKELSDLALMVPHSESQMQDMFNNIQKEADKFGISLSDSSGTWGKMVTGVWARAVKDSRLQLENDNAWSVFGKTISDKITQGTLGMSWKQFLHYLITGKAPTHSKTNVPSLPPGLARDYAGNMPHKADGGPIVGPGGPRDDAIPIMASNGEYIMPAHATKKYYPVLEAMRNRKFADGGIVDMTSLLAPGVVQFATAMSTVIDDTAIRASDYWGSAGGDSLFGATAGGGSVFNPKTSKGLPAAIGHALTQFVPNIITALSGHNLPTTQEYINAVLYRMSVEDASGELTSVNRWDRNWVAGTPSVGLMQVIGPTFADNAGPYKNKGPFLYGVSIDPTANIYAGIGHAIGAYGGPQNFLGVMHQAGGYDNGGILPHRGLGINMSGTPEVVFNAKQWNTLDTLARVGSHTISNQLDNSAGAQYNIEVNLHGSSVDANDVADVIVRKLQMKEMRSNQNRRIGSHG